MVDPNPGFLVGAEIKKECSAIDLQQLLIFNSWIEIQTPFSEYLCGLQQLGKVNSLYFSDKHEL